MQKLRYAGYIRMSDQRQADGYSLDAQRSAIEKYVTQQNGLLVQMYTDSAISATSTAKRDDFHRMRSDARRGLFDVLVVHKFDRLARNRLDAITTKIMLRKDLGIKVLSASGEPSVDTDPIMGGLIEGVMEAMAEWYSINLGNEVRKSRMEMLEQKKWYGIAPYGYRRDAELGILVPEETEAPIVRWLFEAYAQDEVGMQKLVYTLNEGGNKTRQFKNKGGREWTKPSVRAILKSRTYLGELPHQPISRDANNKVVRSKTRTWVQGTHEPLVSAETFDRCQEIMKNNSHNKKRVPKRYMLDGLVYCAACQMIEDMDNPIARMHGRARRTHKNGIQHRYYNCKRKPHSHGAIRADSIEPQLIEFLLSGHLVEDFDGKEKTIAAIAADYETAEIQKRIAEIGEKISRMEFRFDNGAFTGDPQEFLAERQKLEDEIAILRFRVDDSYEYALSVMNDFPGHWAATEGDFEKQRALIRTVVHQVIVSGKQLAAVILKPSHQIVFTHRITGGGSGGNSNGGGDDGTLIEHGSMYVPPPSGIKPTRAKISANFARSLTNRRSQASARSQPMPAA